MGLLLLPVGAAVMVGAEPWLPTMLPPLVLCAVLRSPAEKAQLRKPVPGANGRLLLPSWPC